MFFVVFIVLLLLFIIFCGWFYWLFCFISFLLSSFDVKNNLIICLFIICYEFYCVVIRWKIVE